MPSIRKRHGVEEAEETPSRLPVSKVLVDEFRPYRSELLLSALLSAVAAATELTVVYLIAVMGTAAVSGGDAQVNVPGAGPMTTMAVAALLLAAVAVRCVVQLVAISAQQRLLCRYEQRTRTGLLNAFLDAEWAVQDSMESSDIYTTVFHFLNGARAALSGLLDAVRGLVSFTLMAVGSIVIGGYWTLLMMAATVMLALSVRPLVRASHRAGSATRDEGKAFAFAMNESISLASEIRLYGVTAAVQRRNRSAGNRYAAANRRVGLASGRLTVAYSTVVYAAASLGIVSVLLLRVDDPAPYISVVLLLFRGLIYAQSLQSSYQGMVANLPETEWLRQVRRDLERNRLPTGGVAFTPPIDQIAFDHVTFDYGTGSPALSEVSFDLRRGEALGIVGPSGAGKSTLIQLLLRLRLPTGGTIRVNDQDLAALDPATWFGSVVLVPQEAGLSNGTVVENVRWFRDHITREAAIAALDAAHVLDEVRAMPDGVDTRVGEGGNRLSGGQRQRVCIARALAGSPEVLILDEPTSALDVLSEEGIRRTLAGLRGRVTIVIIAHRLSTLRICERVMVLKGGRIEALGIRPELEAENPFYVEALRLSRLV